MKILWYLHDYLRKRVLHGITFEIGPTSAPPIMEKANTIEWNNVLSCCLKLSVRSSIPTILIMSILGEVAGDTGGDSTSGMTTESSSID
jgi:hypothetical protein